MNNEESKGGTYGDGFDGAENGNAAAQVTIDMKMDFVAKVKKLSNEGLTKLVKHVQSQAEGTMTNLGDERV